jgi:hypothetical protein
LGLGDITECIVAKLGKLYKNRLQNHIKLALTKVLRVSAEANIMIKNIGW